jgi:hypothetical protein
MKSSYTWYVEPFGCLMTNRILSDHLSSENACIEKLCEDGEERNMWRCGHALISELERVRKSLNLNFRVYVQEGAHGAVRLWKFTDSTKRAVHLGDVITA